MAKSVFHLAIHVTDLDEARAFYGDAVGCAEGRSAETWVDFDFFGHQLSCHLGEPFSVSKSGQVGGYDVPMPHFGVVLQMEDWQALRDRLKAAKVRFILPPHTRWKGRPGEQATMFFADPFGNPLEIKGVAHFDGVFENEIGG